LTRAANTSEGFFMKIEMGKISPLTMLTKKLTYKDTSSLPNVEKVNPINIEELDLLLNFNYNEKFLPIRDLIDKKLEPFFKKLVKLSKHGEELKKLKKSFYNILYQRIMHDSYLMNNIEIINKSQKELDNGDKDIYKNLIIKAGLNNFKPIIDDILEIPDLVLSAFDITSERFKKQIKHLQREKSLLHQKLDKDNSEDRRKPEKQCEDYIKEFLKFKHNKKLNKSELAEEIQKWIKKKYPGINYSVSTIRPKLSIPEISKLI